jgi:Tol biopolymer transport system component
MPAHPTSDSSRARRSVTGAAMAALAGALLPVASSVTAQEPSPTPRAPGAWFFAIEPGMCFDDAYTPDGDWDFATLPVEVDCDLPHDNEVVATVSMGSGAFPEGDLEPMVVELCEPEYQAFLGRPSDATLVTTAAYWPIEGDWDAGATDAICTVYGSGKLVGSARSGALRAPGEVIAVFREVDRDPDIWSIDGGTGEIIANLSNASLTELIDVPSWHPDGSRLAFAAQVTDGRSDLFEVEIASGTVTRLLALPGEQNGPAYHPDGGSIAYVSRASSDDEYDIHVTDLATGESRQLTDFPGRDASPDWSPDGTRLAFRRDTGDVSDIWVMNADGSVATQLTDGQGENYDPRWSPDGTRILFTTDRAGNDDLWIMDADGANQRPLTTHPADESYPAWSSDGELIVFRSSRYNGDTLWIMRADGSDASLLATLSPVGWPRFAPR